MIKHISLFSGIGGAEAALDACDVEHETLWRSEIDPKVDRIYEHIWGPDGVNVGDISDFGISTTPSTFHFLMEWKVDLLTGGFPCQPFSRLGERKGIADERFIKPFEGMLKVIEYEKPKYIMLENVPLPKDAIEHVLSEIAKLGYQCIVTSMCPNKDLGFVQKRKRIYITCWRSDQDAWVPNTEYLDISKQKFVSDKNVNTGRNGNCFAVNENRVVNVFDGSSTFCITARGHDAHCRYMTWLECDMSHTGYRGYTPFELFQLFGWDSHSTKFMTAIEQTGISRSSFYHAVGNSWHVGHAAFILSSCPLV